MKNISKIAFVLSLPLLYAPFECAAAVADEATPDTALKSTLRLRLRTPDGDAYVNGWGSAVAVDLSDYGVARPRYLLSAAHLVLNKNGKRLANGELSVEVPSLAGKQWQRCKVVAVDNKADLCLLECAIDLPVLSRLGDGKNNVGDQLLIIGCPAGVEPTVSRGKLVDKQPNVEGELWEAAAKFYHGNSGGPVFDAQSCRITGIAVAGIKADHGDMDRNRALFCHIAVVRRFLNMFARLNPEIVGAEAVSR